MADNYEEAGSEFLSAGEWVELPDGYRTVLTSFKRTVYEDRRPKEFISNVETFFALVFSASIYYLTLKEEQKKAGADRIIYTAICVYNVHVFFVNFLLSGLHSYR